MQRDRRASIERRWGSLARAWITAGALITAVAAVAGRAPAQSAPAPGKAETGQVVGGGVFHASYQALEESDVAAKMRDGVTLRADIYRPSLDGRTPAPGTFPVLLQRTPYNKNGGRYFGLRGAARGYIVVIQDTRGRYASEGEWYPFRNEMNDGYDTVEWAAALPGSNGKVGMFGGSYVGATQWLAAVTHPPHLAGICPTVTASNYRDGWTYQGGALEQWFDESWTSGLIQNTLDRWTGAHTNALDWDRVLPLADFPLVAVPQAGAGVKSLAPYFQDWLDHPNYDEYWKQFSIEERWPDVQVPVLNMGAWYDIFLGGTLRNYAGMKMHGGSEAARGGQRLVIGLGGHAGWSGLQKIGDVDFGKNAPYDGDAWMLDWYDAILKGQTNAYASAKPVRIFLMGKDEWRDLDDWPPPAARRTRYFLHSGGNANSAAGDGALDTNSPGDTSATARGAKDTFVYDPANPVPTIGGPLCCDQAHLEPGPRDQHDAEARRDVLVYSTPPLAGDLEVIGPLSLDFYASTSAVDTDFTGKLVDVGPDGFARNLTEGILRLRYRDSQETPERAKPGKIYHLRMDLWATGNVFLAGHRMRLEISSSNFPRFDRNLNTGEIQARGTKMVNAANVIYHDRAHPSALIVPVMEQ